MTLESSPNITTPDTEEPSFKLKTYDELIQLVDPNFIVDELIVDNSFTMIFGATGSFKSTVVLDMAVCIQHGLPWQGKATKQRNVAFLSHEDGSGFKKRFLAAAERYGITKPVIYWDDKVPNLLNQKQLSSYVKEFKSLEIGIVVIDTFAYAVAGGEENSSRDMGIAVDTIRELRDAIEGTIIIIHHSGKNVERGARGSSAIKAAADTEIKISAEEYEITLTATKQRHCSLGKSIYLKAEVVPVDNATACVIKQSAASPYRGGDTGLIGKSFIAWQVLENILIEQGDSCEFDLFVKQLERNKLFTKNQKKRESFRKALNRAIEDFEDRGLITVSDGVINLTAEGSSVLEPKTFFEKIKRISTQTDS